MSNESKRLKIYDFGSEGEPLVTLGNVQQAHYLRFYFSDLAAQSVIEEPAYFDRDYLAEFAAFYATSSRNYSNTCRRLHFFSRKVSRSLLRSAVGGSVRATGLLQEAYLGHVVVRPIPAAPLGRTVVRWYPDDKSDTTPRVTYPSREYHCHLAGITLKVTGLAWQQQDTGVGACATIALWTMLHSSAFDDHHAIPTTADITRYAHRTASLGQRIFPSSGLNGYQLSEAIKESGLAPVVIEGDQGDKTFSRDRFCSVATSLIRSGYPILIGGLLEGVGHHAVCSVGFREAAPPQPQLGRVELQDAGTQFYYIHDDNIGSSVRFEVVDELDSAGKSKYVKLGASTPPRRHQTSISLPPDPTQNYPALVPQRIIAAVHNDLRTSPDALHIAGLKTAQTLVNAHNLLFGNSQIGLTMSTYLMKLHRYVGEELKRTVGDNPKLLSEIRLALVEKVPPMSLHVGLVRVGWGSTPLVDILYDTTDSDRHLPSFGYIAYDELFWRIVELLRSGGYLNLGVGIRGF